MADGQENDAGVSAGGGLLGAIASGLGKVWDFVTSDPYVNSMAKMGADEIGQALKPFPDSISEYRYNHSYADDSPAFEPPQSTLARPADAVSQPDTGRANDVDAGCSM